VHAVDADLAAAHSPLRRVRAVGCRLLAVQVLERAHELRAVQVERIVLHRRLAGLGTLGQVLQRTHEVCRLHQVA
jgi:hypothetical protein